MLIHFRKITITVLLLISVSLSHAATLRSEITGIQGSELKNVETLLQQAQQAETQPLDLTSIRRLHAAAPEAIRKALQPYGYFKAEVKAYIVQSGVNSWTARYDIKPGPPLTIQKVNLIITGAGASDAAFKNLLSNSLLKPGQALDMAKYKAAKDAVFKVAEQQGYLKGQFKTHEIAINLAAYSAVIDLHFDTGPRYYFGKVQFQKNPLSPRFLQRYVPFKEGQPYNPSEIFKLQDNLNNSTYFHQVLVQPDLQNIDNAYVPVQVNLAARRPQQFSFGLGYGTDTGPRGTIGWDRRYLNEKGHRLSTLLRLSQVQSTLQSVYVIPGANPLTDQYNLNASILTNKLPLGDSITTKVGAASIKSYGHWQRTFFLNYQLERYRFVPNKDYNFSKLLLPGMTWEYTRSDNILFPMHGHRFTATVQGAAKAVLSDTSLIQFRVADKYIHQLGEANRLLLRGELGYTVVKDGHQELPLSLSYFTGGARSVRGYAYQGLGPGRYLVVGSIEYQQHIKGNWYATVFFDAGNAYYNFPATGSTFHSLKRGVGTGIVWNSPVGPINVSIAKALSSPGQPMKVQFSMGPDL